jgi:hypothetical protein
MNALSIPVLLGSAGFITLVLLTLKGVAMAGELSLIEDGADIPACTPEFVSRVFSSEDARFISGARSDQLAKLFHSERKAVALIWVRQISVSIQSTMRDHTRIARSSEGLEFLTELKLFATYIQLMLFCGLLFVAIQSVGPSWLGSMATYVDAHSQRLASAQQSFRAATAPREFPRVGAA